jgi:L-cysteine S-thiosulfotransferase
MDFACSTCHGDSGKRIRLQPLPFFSKPEEARRIVGQWPAYRVSTAHVMTMQHRIYDCLWQIRLGAAVIIKIRDLLAKSGCAGQGKGGGENAFTETIRGHCDHLALP